MKRKLLVFICFLAISFSYAKTYYIHPAKGNDKNIGTSLIKPWKSFKNIDSIILESGDIIALASGYEIKGSLILKNVNGSINNPIIINSYISDKKSLEFATINSKGFLNGILLENC